jgi:hypothetical protein
MRNTLLVTLALSAAYALGTLQSPARADEQAREQMMRDLVQYQRAQVDTSKELVRAEERQADALRDLVRATERCKP